MSEIEKGKRRERILEGELAKLVGENWLVCYPFLPVHEDLF